MEPTGVRTHRTSGVPLLTYQEDGFSDIPRVRLDDAEYGRVLQSKVLANVDIILLNPRRRTFYLARRVAKPMLGWWWMGGNTGDINTPLPKALGQVLKREIGFSLPPERMVLQFIGEYFWKDRSQEPKDLSCHMCGLTFSAEITEEEAAQIKLDPKEYEEGKLVEFTRADLVREGVFPVLIDAYDVIFPPKALRHVVLITFRKDVSQYAKDRVYDLYQTLAEDCGGAGAGILSFKVERNLERRKNVELVEVATFRDNAALQAFRAHPKHAEITDILREIADWQVGDIEV